jgi:hypothetical protein
MIGNEKGRGILSRAGISNMSHYDVVGTTVLSVAPPAPSARHCRRRRRRGVRRFHATPDATRSGAGS